MKKILLAAALIIWAASAEAAVVPDKLPLLTYAEAPVTVYDSPNGTKKGTIPVGSSLVLVKEIRADGWAYGSYKFTGKNGKTARVYRWFKMAELQGYADFENCTDRAAYDTDACRTRTSSSLAGKILSGEDLIVVAVRGGRAKVIFKDDGVYYRMGWVESTALETNSSAADTDNDTGSDSDEPDDSDWDSAADADLDMDDDDK